MEMESEAQIGDLGRFKIQIYRTLTDQRIHMAIIKGDIAGDEPVLARVQAASHGIDVFGFSTSDSNTQLALSLEKISKEGKGVLLYLNIAGEDSEQALRNLRLHLGKVSKDGLGNA